jgi:hypothetical protein
VDIQKYDSRVCFVVIGFGLISDAVVPGPFYPDEFIIELLGLCS